MIKKIKLVPVVLFIGLLIAVSVCAQNQDRRQTDAGSESAAQSPDQPSNQNSLAGVANEIALLRKSVQTLNARLRELGGRSGNADPIETGAADKASLTRNLALLTQVEQRAEMMRRQLFELIEKEASLKSRQVQLEEDMRPENVERTLNAIGTTRTVELRDTRRRALEYDRRGVVDILGNLTQARIRLEEDLRQADAMVAKLRQRLLPVIDKEIEKIQPN